MRAMKLVGFCLITMLAACGGGTAATSGPGVTTGPATQGTAPTGAAVTTGPAILPTAAPEPTSGEVPETPAAGTGTSVAHVEVASGPLAGTYDKSGPKVDCNASGTGVGDTFLDLAETKGLTGVTLTTSEGGANPKKFYFQVNFADPSAGILNQPSLEVLTIDGLAPKGSGSVTVQDNGGTIKGSFDGKTADGIGVKATIECGPVDRY